MPDTTYIVTALRNELELAGLIRRSTTAGPGVPAGPPPALIEPAGGAPGPGDRFDERANTDTETAGELVVTLRLSGDLAEGPFDSYRRRTVIDVIYRSSTTTGLKASRALDAAIRARLVERPDYGFGFTIGGPTPLFVLQASIFGGLGPVSDEDGVRTELAKYALEVLAN